MSGSSTRDSASHQIQNLKHHFVPTSVVKVSDLGGFEVRGLSPYDLTALCMRHRGELSGMFDMFSAKVRSGEAVNVKDGTAMIASIFETAPMLVGDVIALATGSDPADVENWVKDGAIVQKMSLPLQIEALQKIAGLTFSADTWPTVQKARKTVARRNAKPKRGAADSNFPATLDEWLWEFREQVSLLLDHGHPQANRYPIPLLRAESHVTLNRLDRRSATQALMMRRAISSVLSTEGGKAFDEAVKELNGE